MKNKQAAEVTRNYACLSFDVWFYLFDTSIGIPHPVVCIIYEGACHTGRSS